jgi:hypothetical protein
VKILCAALLAVCVAGGAAADTTNSVTFTQDPGADGQYHLTLTVTYVFPGTPPRTGNFGAGTVRVTLPGIAFTLDPSQPPDAGYNCFVAPSNDNVTCSNDGQPTDTGLTFPTSLTIHLLSPTCWSPASDGSAAAADVWSAPADPGTAPDASLPVTPTGDCSNDNALQPVLPGQLAKCKVPKLANVPLASATRRLRNAHCARGKVRYVRSKKVASGKVISQAIKPGKLLVGGSKVNLVVSRG